MCIKDRKIYSLLGSNTPQLAASSCPRKRVSRGVPISESCEQLTGFPIKSGMTDKLIPRSLCGVVH
jgi:hypothetical protein